MAAHAAVGVDDDLAAGEAGVADRATDDEATGRVDEDAVVVVGELLGDDRADDVLDEVGADDLVAVDAVVVLGRDEHGAQAHRLAVLVVEGDLGLAVGPQVRDRAGPADLGQALGHAVRQVDRQRHELVGLVARVAEHHPLVAGALLVEQVLAAGARAHLFGVVDALGDVGRLLVERHQHADGAAVVAVGLAVVADLVDRAGARPWGCRRSPWW